MSGEILGGRRLVPSLKRGKIVQGEDEKFRLTPPASERFQSGSIRMEQECSEQRNLQISKVMKFIQSSIARFSTRPIASPAPVALLVGVGKNRVPDIPIASRMSQPWHLKADSKTRGLGCFRWCELNQMP